MKKFVSIVLALTMILSMATVAFATNYDENNTAITYPEEEYTDVVTVTIDKTYAKSGTGNSESPAETFKFSIVDGWTEGEETVYVLNAGVEVDDKDIPTPTIANVTYEAGEAGSDNAVKQIKLTLPEYDGVGVYYYTITEADNGTAGVTYHNTPIKLVVTVIEQGGLVRVAAVHTEVSGDKSDDITNTYSAGDLTVSKEVTGLMGDQEKDFTFTVTFTAPTGDAFASNQIVTDTVTTARTYTAGENNSTTYVEYTFTLKHDETATFTNIPAGTEYTVAEATPADYTAKVTNEDTNTTVDAGETVDVTVTNNKDGDVDTGITMDTIPYIVVLAVAVFGLVAVVANKRRAAEF